MHLVRKHIAVVLLVIFGGLQLMPLHELTHDSDNAACDVCMMVQHIDQQAYLPVAIIAFVPTIAPAIKQDICDYYAFAKAETPQHFFSIRPPPVFTHLS